MKQNKVNAIEKGAANSGFWRDKTIMLVDDMDSIRCNMKSILKPLGMLEILEGINGKDALIKMREHFVGGGRVELIISDINMPICGGIELLQKCKASNTIKKIPFIIASTENESEVVMKAIALGAANYIIKPFDEMTVKKKLYEVFGKDILKDVASC